MVATDMGPKRSRLSTPDHANLFGEKNERRDVRFCEFQSPPFYKGPPSLPLAVSPVGREARRREGGPLGVPFVCRVVEETESSTVDGK